MSHSRNRSLIAVIVGVLGGLAGAGCPNDSAAPRVVPRQPGPPAGVESVAQQPPPPPAVDTPINAGNIDYTAISRPLNEPSPYGKLAGGFDQPVSGPVRPGFITTDQRGNTIRLEADASQVILDEQGRFVSLKPGVNVPPPTIITYANNGSSGPAGSGFDTNAAELVERDAAKKPKKAKTPAKSPKDQDEVYPDVPVNLGAPPPLPPLKSVKK